MDKNKRKKKSNKDKPWYERMFQTPGKVSGEGNKKKHRKGKLKKISDSFSGRD